MEKEIYFGMAWVVDGPMGIEVVPYDLCSRDELPEYTTNAGFEEYWEVEEKEGWLARMTMPGYLDSTEWTIHDSEEEAEKYLEEYYGEEE